MVSPTKAFLVCGAFLLGAVGLFGLTVYPFQYGLVESAILAGAFVLVALFETALDDTSF
ncbi:hypothetical protein [Halopelagius longus]|uniref:Uncharacterized protein n=1 Tax=Halopelagius longus TaxID=1236180 RepID=A0A1H1DTN7_9EURY|nr:hypothetical protein [Halopelagius longus]SDQ79608.1 hypothetical protein SAMN05216278_2567 [Halopelagius longus]